MCSTMMCSMGLVTSLGPNPGKHPRIHRRTTFIIMGSVKQLAIEGPQKYFSNGGGERGR